MKKAHYTKADIKVEWLDQKRWLQGTVGTDYDFIAKVSAKMSKFGISSGRVVTFVLWNSHDKEAGAMPIAEYYGDWTIQPENEKNTALVELIVSRLEEE